MLIEMWIYDESMMMVVIVLKLVVQDKISVGIVSEFGQQGGEGYDSIVFFCIFQFLI